MPYLVEVDSNNDDEDDDDDNDVNVITRVPVNNKSSASTTRNVPPVSNRPSASTTKNLPRAPQTSIPPKAPPTSTMRI